MGLDLPAGIGLKHRTEGTRLTLDLLYDPELWSEKFTAHPPKIRLIEDTHTTGAYDVAWRRIAPGQFSVSRDVDEGSVIRGAIQVGSYAIPFGPLTLGSSVEWAFEPERISELRTVSRQTGGRELSDLSTAWLRPPFIDDTSLRLPLCILLLGVMIIEALLTRTGWKMPAWAWSTAAPKAKTKATMVKRAKPTKPREQPILPEKSESPSAAEPVPAPSADEEARRSRFQKAKDRK
jgi:hypothetical protein